MPANKCPRCGFDLPPNQVSPHMIDDCIRLIAEQLRSLREATAGVAAVVDDLKRKTLKKS